MKYYEEDFTSPAVKRLLGILAITLSDNETNKYIFELLDINISPSKITDIRQQLSQKAITWYEEMENKNLTCSIKEFENAGGERMVMGIDEGKVNIRSEEKNSENGKHDREWKNIKFVACYEIDENGNKDSETKYGGNIEIPLEKFGKEVRELMVKTGYLFAETQVTISDGANGYYNFLKNKAGSAIHILDAIHLKEHLWELGRSLYPELEEGKPSDLAWAFVESGYKLLKEKGYNEFITYVKKNKPRRKDKKTWDRNIQYFENNKERLNYPEYIRQGLPLGSGIIEGGIKYVCNKRLKNGSPSWLLKNAKGLLKLRIIWFNDYYDEYCNWRKNHLLLKKQWLA